MSRVPLRLVHSKKDKQDALTSSTTSPLYKTLNFQSTPASHHTIIGKAMNKGLLQLLQIFLFQLGEKTGFFPHCKKMPHLGVCIRLQPACCPPDLGTQAHSTLLPPRLPASITPSPALVIQVLPTAQAAAARYLGELIRNSPFLPGTNEFHSVRSHRK